ncbi:hypothetical protein [Streptomyces olivochromogenes]|uniref:hypothetical protein n=1 Tax=Streptomyces olivochromogenes TaxID=1963 RepID=UPI001F27CA8A|nr:hypothetical protein [Streptomyces olivochromogenes]MCF3130351.1 hypothetical protein [Streptomyces olivochromogenes]
MRNTPRTGRTPSSIGSRGSRARRSLVLLAAVAGLPLTGCGTSGNTDEGREVRLVNHSAWDARVLDCPVCGKQGMLIEGNDTPSSSDDSGMYVGWREKRDWPVTYRVVVHGVRSTCPVITPTPTEPGSVGSRDIIYVVNAKGMCEAGPSSWE